MTNVDLNYLIEQLLAPLRENHHNWGAIKHRKMFRFLQENLRINQSVTDHHNHTEILTHVEVRDENGSWNPIYNTPEPVRIKRPTRTQPYTTDIGITIPPLEIDQYS